VEAYASVEALVVHPREQDPVDESHVGEGVAVPPVWVAPLDLHLSVVVRRQCLDDCGNVSRLPWMIGRGTRTTPIHRAESPAPSGPVGEGPGVDVNDSGITGVTL
jgi:hypothetical protein